MRRLGFAILAFSMGLLVVLIAKGVQIAVELQEVPREAYASDWTAVLIIDHIRTSGEWPSGWEDLQDEFDRLAVLEFYAWTFEELQGMVEVDWDVRVADERESPSQRDWVRLKSGRRVNYAGDPNELIYNYLQTGEDPNQIHERIGANYAE